MGTADKRLVFLLVKLATCEYFVNSPLSTLIRSETCDSMDATNAAPAAATIVYTL